MRQFNGRVPLGIVLVTAVAAAAAIGAWTRAELGSTDATVEVGSGTALFPEPADLAELVARADVIVVGTVVRTVFTGELAPYDAGPGYAGRRLPVTDYEIRPDRVLVDDAARAQTRLLVLRVFGQPRGDDSKAPFPMPKIGDRDLFFLTANPDPSTYGLYFATSSRIRIDRSVATYSDGARSDIPFAPGLRPDEFIARVLSVARR